MVAKWAWARAAAAARLAELQTEMRAIQKVFPDLDALATPRKRGRMSAEGRAKIAAAQRKRWAKVRAEKKR
jgi:hypothetical protein